MEEELGIQRQVQRKTLTKKVDLLQTAEQLRILLFIHVAIINHPVHIVSRDNKTSPSSFIPFCEFGGNMSTVGENIDLFDVPICNSFQAKNLNDQLCYEVDLRKEVM